MQLGWSLGTAHSANPVGHSATPLLGSVPASRHSSGSSRLHNPPTKVHPSSLLAFIACRPGRKHLVTSQSPVQQQPVMSHCQPTCKNVETEQLLSPEHHSLNASQHGRPRQLTCQDVILAKDQNETHPGGLPDHGASQAVSVLHCRHIHGRRMDQQPRPLQSQ